MTLVVLIAANTVTGCPSSSGAPVTGVTSIHLSNEDYPAKTLISATAANCRCSVETNSGENITVTAIDIRFRADASAICRQSISLTDELQGTEFVIDCSSNNNYTVSTVYTSTSNFLQVAVTDDLAANEGYFWIAFSGT
jgi:hypothetical protein